MFTDGRTDGQGYLLTRVYLNVRDNLNPKPGLMFFHSFFFKLFILLLFICTVVYLNYGFISNMFIDLTVHSIDLVSFRYYLS